MSKIILAILFIASTATAVCYLVPQYKVNQDLKRQNETTRLEILKNQKEVGKLQNKIQGLHDDKSVVEKVAREKWNMCKPGERIYRFTDEDLFKKKPTY